MLWHPLYQLRPYTAEEISVFFSYMRDENTKNMLNGTAIKIRLIVFWSCGPSQNVETATYEILATNLWDK